MSPMKYKKKYIKKPDKSFFSLVSIFNKQRKYFNLHIIPSLYVFNIQAHYVQNKLDISLNSIFKTN